MKRFPLNLQFFAPGDGGGAGGGDNGGSGNNNPAPNQAPAAVHQPNADDIAAAILKATENRTQRVEASVVKSMADQYGITEAEARAALEKAKADKAGKLPDDVQRKLDEANAKVRTMQISVEMAKIGAELGLVDADVALQLIPADAIKVDDKGVVSGVKEALENLKKTKPYLFGAAQKPGAMAQRVGGAPAGTEKTAQDELRERLYPK